MDPCPFLRVLVGNLSLKLPRPSSAAAPTASAVHPSSSSSSSFFCKIKLSNLPPRHASLPLASSPEDDSPGGHPSQPLAASFSLPKPLLEKLALQNPTLRVEVYRGRLGSGCGLVGGSKLIGKVCVPLDLRRAEPRAVLVHNGWVDIGRKSGEKLHVSVRAEPDPRFLFEFEKEPECSPQVFQVQGSVKQPVFTCNFSCRNSNVGDRNLRSRSSFSETSTSRSWIPSLVGNDKDPHSKERKGWSITIHDLSGSPVAAASMVTPFVPSPGSDRVSRSNPGAWLILRPGHGTWSPWGRLEAWLEHGSSEMLSYRFKLLPDTTASTTATVADSSISIKTGGKFSIDLTTSVSPMSSPSSSMDFGSGSWSGSGSGSDFVGLGLWPSVPGGFVMSSTMQGVDRASKPQVEVGVQHVTCTEDAAAFVALAAAVDLSMDACKLFSQKLRTELRQQSQDCAI
ncbi:hypothetical protein NL676_015850 [Syzygium grande]|nr:hypothetical protein NL676_015850 [Syzygium grande]